MCKHEPLTLPDAEYPHGVFMPTGSMRFEAITQGGGATIDDFRICKLCGCLYSEAVHLGLWKKPQLVKT